MSDATYESIAIWSQVAASVLFIIALIVIWNKYIAPAVLASQARKNAELAESEKRRDDARAAVEAASAEIVTADTDAGAIATRAQTDATRLHDKILADARNEGERLMRGAEGELERSRAAARNELRDELLERAIAIARDSATQVDDGTNRRLVGDAVDAAERGGTR